MNKQSLVKQDPEWIFCTGETALDENRTVWNNTIISNGFIAAMAYHVFISTIRICELPHGIHLSTKPLITGAMYVSFSKGIQHYMAIYMAFSYAPT